MSPASNDTGLDLPYSSFYKAALLQFSDGYNVDPGAWVEKKACSIHLLNVDKIIHTNLSFPACNVDDLSVWPFAEDGKGIEGNACSCNLAS